MTERAPRLLGPEDPAPVARFNAFGVAPFLLTGDHAGLAIPCRLGTLGLEPADLERHIACDIGIAALGEALADKLDAVFLHQPYSRLVIDCNRDPASDDAIPIVSDGTPIPGNDHLSAAEREARIAAIHDPYQRTIADTIVARQMRGQETILVALHSFTPIIDGKERPWDIGVLHDGHDDSFARAVLASLETIETIHVGDNAPYRMDATDHSVPRHAFDSDLPYVELEVRQDHLANDAGLHRMTQLLSRVLLDAHGPIAQDR